MTKAAASNAADTNRMLVQARFGVLDRGAVLSPSWLGHKHKRGSTIDHLLLFGATMQELIAVSGSKNASSVRGHIAHLQIEHGLTIVRDRHHRYTIDVDESDDSDDLFIGQDRWSRVDDTVITESGALADKGPALDEFPVTRHEPAPTIPIDSDESPTAQHWGAVLVDGEGVASVALGMDAIRRRAHPDLTDVAVILSGSNLGDVNVALAMVETLINTHRNGEANDWSAGYSWASQQYYVYLHRDAEGVFYIGKGIKDRAFDHVKKAFDAWNGGNGRLSSRKHQRIIEAISPIENPTSARLEQYRTENIRSYPMPISPLGEMMSFLAEDVLITHLNSVFELTNETGGNNCCGDYAWLSQPYDSAAVPGRWSKAAEYFLRHRRLSSDAKANFTEIRAQNLMSTSTGVVSDLAQIPGASLGEVSKRGQDVFIDLSIDALPIRMQLLFSAKNPTVKLNIRPALNVKGQMEKAKAMDFERAVDRVLIKNSSLDWRLCLKGDRDPYVKPFRDAKRSATDPSFSAHDRHDRCDVFLPGTTEILSFNLMEAAQYVRNLFATA